MVDVEQHALRALEQDPATAAPRLVQVAPNRARKRKDETSNLGEVVYQRIAEALIKGALRPGERLKIRDLAQEMGTSVTPVRDAMIRLATWIIVSLLLTAGGHFGPLDVPVVATFGDGVHVEQAVNAFVPPPVPANGA